MLKSTRNQLGNSKNYSQGDTKKVLTVCSAGLLRSATAQNFLIKEYGYNVRNCGTARDFALVPISEALVFWADEIVFVNLENFADLENYWNEDLLNEDDKVIILCIPDNFGFNDPRLVKEIKHQYELVQKEMIGSDQQYFTVKRNAKSGEYEVHFGFPL